MATISNGIILKLGFMNYQPGEEFNLKGFKLLKLLFLTFRSEETEIPISPNLFFAVI